MKPIALFLDVDDTLTQELIQANYAREIGCYEEYEKIEQEFQSQAITSTEFGEKLIALFAQKEFTDAHAKKYYDNIKKQPWTKDLLTLNEGEKVDIFLVSSGPSYYIERLANEFNIPEEQICYSQYSFDPGTGIISGCDAVSDAGKANFVNIYAKNYVITIGVGDHPELDGPFITNCTIGFLIQPSDKYLYLPSFELLINFVNALGHTFGQREDDTGTLRSEDAEDVGDYTIVQLLGKLKPGQLKAAIGSLALLLTVTAAGAYWVGSKSHLFESTPQ